MDRKDLIGSYLFSTREARIKNELQLRKEIEKTTQTKSATDWEEIFNDVGVPSAAIRTIPEIAEHPHLENRGLKLPISSNSTSESQTSHSFTLGPGFTLLLSPKKAIGPAPRLGEHSKDLLLELGYSKDEIHSFIERSVVQPG